MIELYPHFEASSLNFSLDDIASLPSYQLALVQFRTTSFHQQTVARTEWKKRRAVALQRMEEGVVEKEEELRRLDRIKEKLDAASRNKMVDLVTQCEMRYYSALEVRMREEVVRKESREELLKLQVDLDIERAKTTVAQEARERAENALTALQTSPSGRKTPNAPLQTPTKSHSSAPSTSQPTNPPPPGPFFSSITTTSISTPLAPERLLQQLSLVRISNLAPSVTPALLFHHLRRGGKNSPLRPRPLALSKSSNGNVVAAFRDLESAERAVKVLDKTNMPLVKGAHAIKAVLTTDSYHFKESELSDEVRKAWAETNELPDALWTESLPLLATKAWSKEYQEELERIRSMSTASSGGGGISAGTNKLQNQQPRSRKPSKLQQQPPHQYPSFANPASQYSNTPPYYSANPSIAQPFPAANPAAAFDPSFSFSVTAAYPFPNPYSYYNPFPYTSPTYPSMSASENGGDYSAGPNKRQRLDE